MMLNTSSLSRSVLRSALRCPAVSSRHANLSTSAGNSEQFVRVSVDEQGWGTLTLDRPKVHNAFSDHVIAQLSDALDEVKRDSRLRGLFVRSTGKNFCAGGDLEWMRKAAGYSRQENIDDAMALSRMLYKLSSLPVPSVALVQGAAFGGGVGLVAACDIGVGVARSSFMLSEVRLGLIPATISPYVVERIGAQQCKRYFLTAERFDAAKALSMGLLHEVVADEDAMEVRFVMCLCLRVSFQCRCGVL
jgi:methylglutaconyl-CoA hydratase